MGFTNFYSEIASLRADIEALKLALYNKLTNLSANQLLGSGAEGGVAVPIPQSNFVGVGDAQTFTSAKLAACRSSGTLSNPVGGSGRGLEIQSDVSNSAYFSFQIAGQWACYFGLDGYDNQLKIGGWSYGNNSYRVWNETYGTPVWQAPSDRRLKNSIKPITGATALGLISELNPVQFRYTAEIRKTGLFGDLQIRCQPHYGFLAQELPTKNLLLTKSSGELGVNYIEIIPLLVAAIQEQQEQIELLRLTGITTP